LKNSKILLQTVDRNFINCFDSNNFVAKTVYSVENSAIIIDINFRLVYNLIVIIRKFPVITSRVFPADFQTPCHRGPISIAKVFNQPQTKQQEEDVL